MSEPATPRRRSLRLRRQDSDATTSQTSPATSSDTAAKRRTSLSLETSTPKKPKTTAAHTPSTSAPSKQEASRIAHSLPPLTLPDRPYSVHALPVSVLEKMSPHERARRLLHVGATPESLPCRQEQFHAVLECMIDALRSGVGACAYICGVPGTGKTATVREAIRSLQSQREAGQVPSFTFVEINGMKLASPMQAYTELWCAMAGGGKRLHPRAALQRLSTYFNAGTGAKHTPTIVLMDELDLFVTSRQDVIYNMFHWPDLPGSNLIVMAVANTMDLPERTLQPKVASRLGMTRIPFMPYTDKQLLDIVRARLDVGEHGERCSEALATRGCEAVFKLDALIFASKRVANVSGDARRMLDVCRRAVEMAEERAIAQHTEPSPLGILDIREVMDRMARSGRAAHVASLSSHAKLLLASMFACVRRSGVTEVVWSEVLTHHAALCRTHTVARCGMTEPNYSDDEMLRPLASLCALGLVIAVGSGAGNARGGAHARFLLAIQEDDVHAALGSDDENAPWQSLFTTLRK